MKKRIRDLNEVKQMYTVQHLTGEEIARIYGVTRQAVYKRLKALGIKSIDGEWVKTNCSFCGSEITKRRKQWRKNTNNYCSMECYSASLENPGYKPWRHGQRLARAIVGQYYKLLYNNVIHHEDGDSRNNDRLNLRVFANQSDHLKYHRSKVKPIPIWDGSKI